MVSDPSAGRATRWKGLPPFQRFVLVGGVNTLFGYAAFAFFLWIGVHYAGAALLGTAAGVVFNFFTTGRLVFDGTHGVRSVLPFVGVYAFVYGLNVALLACFDQLGIGPYLAGFILIVPLAIVSFALMRRFVFRPAHVAH